MQRLFTLHSYSRRRISVFERDGARLLVDDLSFEHVRGATIDYVRELIRAAFVVAENPNAAEACGCKMSFSVKVS